MNIFRYDEEKEIFEHYAKLLKQEQLISLIENNMINTAEEAIALAEFYWQIVDKCIEEEKLAEKAKTNEYWNEKLLISISGFIERNGFEEQWDDVLDSA